MREPNDAVGMYIIRSLRKLDQKCTEIIAEFGPEEKKTPEIDLQTEKHAKLLKMRRAQRACLAKIEKQKKAFLASNEEMVKMKSSLTHTHTYIRC